MSDSAPATMSAKPMIARGMLLPPVKGSCSVAAAWAATVDVVADSASACTVVEALGTVVDPSVLTKVVDVACPSVVTVRGSVVVVTGSVVVVVVVCGCVVVVAYAVVVVFGHVVVVTWLVVVVCGCVVLVTYELVVVD